MAEDMIKEAEFEPIDEISPVEDGLADDPNTECECGHGCCEDGDCECGCGCECHDETPKTESENSQIDPAMMAQAMSAMGGMGGLGGLLGGMLGGMMGGGMPQMPTPPPTDSSVTPMDSSSSIEKKDVEPSLPDPNEVKRKMKQKELDELNKKFDDAMELCLKAHEGQKDLVGAEYSDHPCRVSSFIHKDEFMPTVMDKVAQMKIMITALLHDMIEDTDVTKEEIEEKFGKDIAEAVVALTRTDEDTDYVDYILRVEKNDIAKWVKFFDLKDNLDIFRFIDRGIELTEKDTNRINKYGDAYLYLKKKLYMMKG